MFLLPQSAWEVRTTKNKGRGMFARQDIKPGVVFGDYLGTVIRSADEDEYEKDDELYLMYYHDYASIYPDKSEPGVHLLNHSCMPNCWVYTYRGHTLFFTLRRIFAGEELTISYLLSPIDEYCKPCTHFCKCGTILCTGSMHLSHEKYKRWRHFDDRIAQQTKRERAQYGKQLQSLESYPETIPDHEIYDMFGSFDHKPFSMENKTLPNKQELRQKIRETGKQLYFSAIRVKIAGFYNNLTIII